MRASILYLSASLTGAFVASCSNPECREGEYRIADTCYRKIRPDSGTACDASSCSESSTGEGSDGGARDRDGAAAPGPDHSDGSSAAGPTGLAVDAASPGSSISQPLATDASVSGATTTTSDGAASNDPGGGSPSPADASAASANDSSAPKDSCPPNACNPGGKCISAFDDWTCECGAGYSGTGTKSCDDVDACTGVNLCDHPSWPCAETTASSYTCLGRFAPWPIVESTAPGSAQPNFSVTETVVTDKITGLVWQRQLPATYPGCTCDGACGTSSSGRRCTHPEARAYCEGLALDGATDWRLPGVIDFVSIFDYAKFTETAFGAVDAQTFPPPPGQSTYEPFDSWKTSDVRWRVDFGMGLIDHFVTQSDGGGGLVRCVRGPKPDSLTSEHVRPEERFSINASGDIVTDRWTTLQWTRSSSAEALNWGGARIYCRNLGMDLPTPKQLLSLVDPARVPTIDTMVFSDTPQAAFWTLLKFPITDPEAPRTLYRTVNFENGESQMAAETDKLRVRCVR